MKVLAAVLLFLFPVLAIAAGDPAIPDVRTSWADVTLDDAGNPLPSAIDEWRVYDCTDVQLAVVPVGTLEFIEADAAAGMTSGSTVCRRVRAYRAPFLAAPADGVFTAVVPGQTTVTTSVVPQ